MGCIKIKLEKRSATSVCIINIKKKLLTVMVDMFVFVMCHIQMQHSYIFQGKKTKNILFKYIT